MTGASEAADRKEIHLGLIRELRELYNLFRFPRRRSAAQVIAELLTELTEEGTFYSLMHTVEEEKRTKAQLHDIIIRSGHEPQQTQMLLAYCEILTHDSVYYQPKH